MASNDYHFITRWRVPGTCDEVSDVVGDALSLPRWWPSVYLDVRELEPGDETGVGKVVDLHTKGWLPYWLRWQFRVTEVDRPHALAIAAWGDFAGAGRWTFAQDGPEVDVTYDWRIRAGKPLLRRLSWLLKPAFAANHRWAMARGEESLRLELQRRREPDPELRALIPAPPPPSALPLRPLAAAFGLSTLAMLLWRKRPRRA
ncbi:MAG: SRPBCC family protein [Dehalococcoidia bacterium]